MQPAQNSEARDILMRPAGAPSSNGGNHSVDKNRTTLVCNTTRNARNPVASGNNGTGPNGQPDSAIQADSPKILGANITSHMTNNLIANHPSHGPKPLAQHQVSANQNGAQPSHANNVPVLHTQINMQSIQPVQNNIQIGNGMTSAHPHNPANNKNQNSGSTPCNSQPEHHAVSSPANQGSSQQSANSHAADNSANAVNPGTQTNQACSSSTEATRAPAATSNPVQYLVDACFRPGKTLDKYRIIDTLGQGTFGKVKLAEHIPTGQRVAIKFIEKKNVQTPRQKASVTRELRLLALMRNANIITVFELIETNDIVAIVMEHASGGELFQLIVQRRRLEEPQARTIFGQIVSAIEYCHQHSVIHRDLKPENLLLDSQMNIKLVDFGFVTTFDGQRLLDTYCGSPFYAAPEMVRGIRYTGPEVDVWSLGVILYAMLCGRLPFDAKDMRKLYAKIASGVFLCPQYISQEACHLLKFMMTVNPRERATIEQVKLHPWMRGVPLPSNSGNITVAAPPAVPNYALNEWLLPCSPAGERELIDIIASFGFSLIEIDEQLFKARKAITNNSNVERHPILGYYRLLRKIWAVAQQQQVIEAENSTRAANSLNLQNPGPTGTELYLKSWAVQTSQSLSVVHSVLERFFLINSIKWRLDLSTRGASHVYKCERSGLTWEIRWYDASKLLQIGNMAGLGCAAYCSFVLVDVKRRLDKRYFCSVQAANARSRENNEAVTSAPTIVPSSEPGPSISAVNRQSQSATNSPAENSYNMQSKRARVAESGQSST